MASGIAVVSCFYGYYLATNRERLDEYYSSRGEFNLGLRHAITMGLFFWIPQTVCAGMFVVGVVCQLFRARQDRWLIALGCLYFVPFWLVLWWPGQRPEAAARVAFTLRVKARISGIPRSRSERTTMTDAVSANWQPGG